MSPFDMAAFAAPISFMIANFSGPSGIAEAALTDLAMFSPVQAVPLADAGLNGMSAAAIDTAAISIFICFLPDCSKDAAAGFKSGPMEKFREQQP
jgi:hypothetical protein